MLNFTLAKSVPYAVRYMNRLQLANYGIKNQKIEFQTPSAVFFHSCLAGLEVSVRLWRVVTVQSYCKMLARYMWVNQIGCDILHVNIKVFNVFFFMTGFCFVQNHLAIWFRTMPFYHSLTNICQP